MTSLSYKNGIPLLQLKEIKSLSGSIDSENARSEPRGLSPGGDVPAEAPEAARDNGKCRKAQTSRRLSSRDAPRRCCRCSKQTAIST
jgi:hypothetical protein